MADFLKSADPSGPLYDKAVVRRNKLLGDIADTADEILADPEFGSSYQRFSDIIKMGTSEKEDIETAKKGLIQIEKEYRAKQQRFFKDKTKRSHKKEMKHIKTLWDKMNTQIDFTSKIREK